jgi:hypothetical protein
MSLQQGPRPPPTPQQLAQAQAQHQAQQKPLQAQLQQQQQVNAAAAAQAQAQGAPLLFRSQAKPPKPPSFHGSLRENVLTWLFAFENYASTCGVADEPGRITLATNYFRDTALTWWVSVVKLAQAQGGAQQPPASTWAAFRQLLEARFQPFEAARTARTALLSIRQRSSVAEYNNAFMRHMQQIDDMGVQDQIMLYRRGLRSYVSNEVDKTNPETLEAAMNMAQRVELRTVNLQREQAAFGRRTQDSYTRATGTFDRSAGIGSSQSTSVPMELGYLGGKADEGVSYEGAWDDIQDTKYETDSHVDTSQSSTQLSALSGPRQSPPGPGSSLSSSAPAPGRMTPEERQRCMDNGLCFRCRQPGHVSNRCPRFSGNRGNRGAGARGGLTGQQQQGKGQAR